MKREIETLVANALRLDPTIEPEAADAVMRILKGEKFVPATSRSAADMLPDTIKRPVLARKFGVSTKTISNWAKRGRLHAVKDQRGQSIGYTSDSVLAIYRGER